MNYFPRLSRSLSPRTPLLSPRMPRPLSPRTPPFLSPRTCCGVVYKITGILTKKGGCFDSTPQQVRGDSSGGMRGDRFKQCNKKRLFCLLVSFILYCSAYAEAIPHNLVIVDTGYDACMKSSGMNCIQNKNLLVRGSQPFGMNEAFNANDFRGKIFHTIETFQNTYQVKAIMPASLNDLKNYRIVIINLLNGYGAESDGKAKERDELIKEFRFSGMSHTHALPEQHSMYGLDTPFNPNNFAFEWWPVTLPKLGLFSPRYTLSNLNWPDQKPTPVHDYPPASYKPIDFTYLITNHYYASSNHENNAKSLVALLNAIPHDGHPLLIFYHCVAGKDRTGVVTMAYYMTYGGYPSINKQQVKRVRNEPMTYDESLKAATVSGSKPNGRAQRLAKLYGQYLNKK